MVAKAGGLASGLRASSELEQLRVAPIPLGRPSHGLPWPVAAAFQLRL